MKGGGLPTRAVPRGSGGCSSPLIVIIQAWSRPDTPTLLFARNMGWIPPARGIRELAHNWHRSSLRAAATSGP